MKKEKHDTKKSKTEICGQKKVKEAVKALKLLNKRFVEEDLKKQPLLEDTAESPIYLQVMLKKIPPPQLMRMIRVPLSHSLITETSEVCLITGDLEKRNHKAEIEPTILHYKDLLRKHGITKVAEVIPLRQLRTEYKTYESKRQLAAAYDVFLADKKIAGVLPKTLGKSFFKDRKFPIQIDLKRPNLKDQIDKALCQTEFSLTCRGNSYALEVARLSMEDDAIMENVKTSIDVLTNKLPGKEKNILSLYIKTAKSKAIPIFVSLEISDDILIKKPRKNEKFKLDELSTIDDAEVKVFRDGRVVLRKMKKESSNNENAIEDDENMVLNESLSDVLLEDEDTQESTAIEVPLKKKKKSKKTSDLIEDTDVAKLEKEEDFQDSVANKSPVKKRKKSKKASELEEIANNEESNQDSIINEVPKKSKKAKKNTDLNHVVDISQVENNEIQDSITEISSKKKKKGKKVITDHVLNDAEMKTEEHDQNSISNEISSKSKKNMNSGHFKADETLKEVRESSILLSSKKRKIHEDITSEKATKYKNWKAFESENKDEIEKITRSKKHKNISEAAEEDINLETTSKSKKGKKKIKDAANMESSLISVKDEEIMHIGKTPLKSKKMKEKNVDLADSDSLILKEKKIVQDSNVKISSKLNKSQKNDRNSTSISVKAKKIKTK
ncbi:ribosomal L1 domain-containing protein 1-like [Argiope bruennichi]|uniref:ribosomal L1 domain-containing protein 1-like n=1 Tax=Argiope bruennichi TaxID=94029 RepID=UPI0024953EEF|nr:ribosomal L1 domain-containing protein 1-like [Argiope bruennichi]